MHILTGPQMRRADERAITQLGIPGLLLMETAGRKVFEEMAAFFPVAGKRIVVVCGRGNNGGDGFVTARHLASAGAQVEVFALGSPADYRGDAAVNLYMLTHTAACLHHILEVKDVSRVNASLKGAFLVVDSLLGTGLTREVTGLYREVIEGINRCSAKTVATDIPSGINSDTGEVMGAAVRAWKTVTFAFPKRGHFFYPGKEHCGEVTVADIFIPAFLGKEEGSNLTAITAGDVRARLPRRWGHGHKGIYGRVFVLAGSPGCTGAAYLTSMAALRSGCGLVSAGVPRGLNEIMENKLTEVMTVPLAETAAGTLSLAARDALWHSLRQSHALAVGPGLGRGEDVRAILLDLLENYAKPLVIDADGLNALAPWETVFNRAQATPILTPHPGEMARLTGLSVQDILDESLAVARQKAKEWGVVLVLKGSPTLVALPGGDVYLNTTGNDGLATGGTGDVLTGLIAGLVAQGNTPEDAAVSAVFLHGRAGDLAAAELGRRGMLATDVLKNLPRAIKLTEEEK